MTESQSQHALDRIEAERLRRGLSVRQVAARTPRISEGYWRQLVNGGVKQSGVWVPRTGFGVEFGGDPAGRRAGRRQGNERQTGVKAGDHDTETRRVEMLDRYKRRDDHRMPDPDVERIWERILGMCDEVDQLEESRSQAGTVRWMQGRRRFRLIKCGCEGERPMGVHGWLCDHREVLAAGAAAAAVAMVAGLALWAWWPPGGGPPVGEPPTHGGTTVSGTATTLATVPTGPASLRTRFTPTPTIATMQPTWSVSMPTVTMSLVATSRPPYTMPPTVPTMPPTMVVTRTVTPTPNLATGSPSIEPAGDNGQLLPTLPTATTLSTVAMLAGE